MNPKERTVRELGGEIGAEFEYEARRARQAGVEPIIRGLISVEREADLIDLIMAVLARHEGKIIVIDKDLPVEPLEYTYPPEY